MSKQKVSSDPEWFWLPTELIDKHLDLLSLRGVGVYCYLARQATLSQYPTIQEIRRIFHLSLKAVVDTLELLYSCQLLSHSDMCVLLPERYTNVSADPALRGMPRMADREAS